MPQRRLVLTKSAAALFVPFLLASPALAQTAGQNPLVIIAGYETSYGTNTNNGVPGNTASGIFQDLNATWAQALADCGCGTTAQYPTAGSALPSVQFAANAALYNAQGFGPWICAGCDPALAAAIQTAGGASAFQAPGTLSTDPSTYAAADTSLADYFATNGAGATETGVDETGQPTGAITGTGAAVSAAGGVGGNAAGGTISSSAAAAGVTGVSSHSFHAYCWLWNEYSTVINQPFTQELTTIQTMIQSWIKPLLTLMLMIMGGMTMFARMRISDYAKKIMIVVFVLPFISVGSVWYETYVVQMFQSLPVAFSQNIAGINSSCPAAGFDINTAIYAAATANIIWALPWLSPTILYVGPMMAFATVVGYLIIATAFAVWMIAHVLLELLLIIGPLILPGMLFERFEGWVDRWVTAMMLMAIVVLGANIITSLVQLIMQAAWAAMPATGQGTQDAFNVLGVTMVLFVLTFAMVIWPIVLQHIAAASGAPKHDHAANAVRNIGARVTHGASALARRS